MWKKTWKNEDFLIFDQKQGGLNDFVSKFLNIFSNKLNIWLHQEVLKFSTKKIIKSWEKNSHL